MREKRNGISSAMRPSLASRRSSTGSRRPSGDFQPPCAARGVASRSALPAARRSSADMYAAGAPEASFAGSCFALDLRMLPLPSQRGAHGEILGPPPRRYNVNRKVYRNVNRNVNRSINRGLPLSRRRGLGRLSHHSHAAAEKQIPKQSLFEQRKSCYNNRVAGSGRGVREAARGKEDGGEKNFV